MLAFRETIFKSKLFLLRSLFIFIRFYFFLYFRSFDDSTYSFVYAVVYMIRFTVHRIRTHLYYFDAKLYAIVQSHNHNNRKCVYFIFGKRSKELTLFSSRFPHDSFSVLFSRAHALRIENFRLSCFHFVHLRCFMSSIFTGNVDDVANSVEQYCLFVRCEPKNRESTSESEKCLAQTKQV